MTPTRWSGLLCPLALERTNKQTDATYLGWARRAHSYGVASRASGGRGQSSNSLHGGAEGLRNCRFSNAIHLNAWQTARVA